jgi:imidazolonepropionase-like amidohydrolase
MRFVYAFLLLTLCSTHGWSQDLAILHAKVYASPNSRPVIGATILIRNGKIVAVGRQLAVLPAIESLDCRGCVVFAGFWNTHVHFMEPKWTDASHLPATQLTRDLQQMLTRSGFTTVVDTGSDTMNTVELRRRIESGEVPGPRIYTAGIPLYPSHALPFYLSGLPPELRNRLPQPETPAEAIASVQQNIAAGSDIVKLFTGSIIAPGQVVPMSAPIASAAVAEAHRHHQLVFTHSTNLEGTRVAMDSGVDVLAHAPEITDGLDDRLLQNLVAYHMAIIPTLKLFSGDADIAGIRSEVFRFHRLGGVLMFGTDTGFLTDYDMGEEYRQLSLAGLGFRQTLTMLTSAPAERFGVSDHEGRIAPGMNADLTILSADPATGDPLAFTQVKYTIRAGRIIFHSR